MSTREDLSDEEKTLVSIEEQLEFGKSSCIKVDYALRKYSFDNLINKDQWVSIVDELDIKVWNSAQSPNTEDFYGLYRNGKGSYCLKEISIIGILCSNGQARAKARLLYELYDPENTSFIDSSFLDDLFDKMAKFTLVRSLTLVSNETLPLASKASVKHYLSKLLAVLPTAKKEFISKMSGEKTQIEKKDFIEKFDDSEVAWLMCSYGFRKFVGKSHEF